MVELVDTNVELAILDGLEVNVDELAVVVALVLVVAEVGLMCLQ